MIITQILRRSLHTVLLLTFTVPTFAADELPDDEALQSRISAAFAASPDYGNALVQVASHRGFILLTGQVPTAEQKTQATNTVVFTSSAIRRIINELEVVDAVDTSTAAMDEALQATVNGSLQTLAPPPAAPVHAVVHKGVVYLLGALDSAEAQRVATHVSTLPGIASIRTAFEILPPP